MRYTVTKEDSITGPAYFVRDDWEERRIRVFDPRYYEERAKPAAEAFAAALERGIETCFWCKQEIYDGKAESGFTGEGPDWATLDGDFGCGDHPISDEDGTGPHETIAMIREIVKKYHS